MVRPGINKALELIEKEYRYIILEFPTGYGKSSGGLELFRKINELGFPENRIIHILPLRAIVEDLAKKLYSELGERVSYQAGIYGLSINDMIIRKSPFFDTDYNVTTFDSFIHNMFKIPITEVFRYLRHHYIPFERIYVSSIIFDEAHIIVEPDEDKMVAGFIASLRLLNSTNNPVIIMTATLTENIRRVIRNVLSNSIFVRLGIKDEMRGNDVFIYDDEFENEIGNTRYFSSLIDSAEIINKTIELINNGKKVLIIINNINFINKIYDELKRKGIPVGFIHGELTRGDRKFIIDNLRNYKVLIGTSAIEAGVNISFDALITVPDDAASLVQRVGRVCRYGECIGELYFVCKDSKDNGIVINEKLCEYLKKNGNIINWRLPYSKNNNTISYSKMLEEFKGHEEINLVTKYLYGFDGLRRPYIPQELINYLFSEKFGFNLSRKELIEVYVKGRDEFKSSSINDIVINSFSTDLDRLTKRLPINCIESLGYIDEEPSLVTNFPIKDFINPNMVSIAYKRFIHKYNALPIIIIKPNCYGGV
mgnify:FL=1